MASTTFLYPGQMLPPRRVSAAPARPRKRTLGEAKTSNEHVDNAPVPVGVAYMQLVTLSVIAEHSPNAKVKPKPNDVAYVLRVEHALTHKQWAISRNYDDYRHFQQRVLAALHHGHFCQAECPWLFTFLKSYFPRKHLFQFNTARVVAARREALERFVTMLQTFVLGRSNYRCSFIGTAVADALVDFVYGDMIHEYPVDSLTNATTNADTMKTPMLPGPFQSATAYSVPHSMSSTSDDDDASSVSVPTSLCPLCESSLDGEAHASSVLPRCCSLPEEAPEISPSVGIAPSSLPSSQMLPSSHFQLGKKSRSRTRCNTYYVTTLGCGHQFHDECIVPKLNETLQCPICGHFEG